MGPPLKTSRKRIAHTYQYYVTAFGESVVLAEHDEVQRVARLHGALFCDPPRFTSFEPPEAACWAFQGRTAWRTRRSAAASRRTSWPRGRRCGRWEFR